MGAHLRVRRESFPTNTNKNLCVVVLWTKVASALEGSAIQEMELKLSNEYQHDRVKVVSRNVCILVLWTKVASALEGLNKVRFMEFLLLKILLR